METLCLFCTTKLQQPPHGRKRKFCTDACKIAYHRQIAGRAEAAISNDQCSACGKKNGNIIGDLDPITKEVRGYLCMKCYKLVKESGEAARMRKVADYLDRTQPPRSFSNEMKRNAFEEHLQHAKAHGI